MDLHGWMKSTYLRLGGAFVDSQLADYKWFAEQEVNSWNHWVPFPLGRRLWLWRHGFTSPYGKLYDLDAHGPEPFLSELQRYRLYRKLNGDHRYLLDDKLSQHWMLHDYPENHPTAYGFLDRGAVHGVPGSATEGPPAPVSEWAPRALREHSKFVLKHVRGKGGKEVLVCEYDDGFVINGESVSEAVLCETLTGLSGYLATEYVHQHRYANELYPHAPNTIRLLTLWDDAAGELLTPMAVHRVGTEQSRPIDNFSAGGVAAEIDLETGELGTAVRYPFSGTVERYETHPDTGAQLAGARVPHWSTVRSTVEAIARENTHVPAIGWDVLLDDSATPVVIEANTGTDLDMMQAHRPLLADPRVAAVVARHLPGVDAPEGEAEPDRAAPTATARRSDPR